MVPGKYKLELSLPYPVDPDKGKAKYVGVHGMHARMHACRACVRQAGVDRR